MSEQESQQPRPPSPQPASPNTPPPPAAAAPYPHGQPTPGAPYCVVQLPRRRGVWGYLFACLGLIVFAGSLLLNLILIVALAGSASGTLQQTVLEDGKKNQSVAVFNLSGTIGEQTTADFRAFYRAVRDSDDIKAVIIRVDSPGGTVAASDEIHAIVMDIRKVLRRPVVISMGGLAASGGYYVSVAGDVIYAENTTVTGSIGVIAVWPVFKDFLNNHGIDVVTLRSRQSEGWKAAENLWEKPDSRIRASVQDMLTEMHKRFADVVKAGRPKLKTQPEKVEFSEEGKQRTAEETEPLNGKVYLAAAAKDWGLVDRIGYFKDAAAEAARLAGLSKPRIVQYSRQKGLRELLGASAAKPPVDLGSVEKLLTPQIMMMWKVD